MSEYRRCLECGEQINGGLIVRCECPNPADPLEALRAEVAEFGFPMILSADDLKGHQTEFDKIITKARALAGKGSK